MSNKENQSELGVEEKQKAALIYLRDTTTDEARAYVEVLSTRLGFGHAIDIELPSPPVERTQDEPEWVKCSQCGRENSLETWVKFGDKCPNCQGLHDKETSSEPTAAGSEQPCSTCGSTEAKMSAGGWTCSNAWHYERAAPVASQAPAPTLTQEEIQRLRDIAGEEDDPHCDPLCRVCIAIRGARIALKIIEANHE